MLPASLGPDSYSASDRNEYQKQELFLGSRAKQVLKADNLSTICELMV
jgi:hypothetical protein